MVALSGADFGVQPGYTDAWGRPVESNPETVRALRGALGSGALAAGQSAPAAPPVRQLATCYLPRKRRDWGFAAQLYAVRSRRSWGIGDMDDLRRLGRWAAASGAGFLQLNPLHAPAPTGTRQPSPYFPSSRRFRNPAYIAVDRVPGHQAAAAELSRDAAAAADLNQRPLIDHTAVHELKLRALGAIWATHPPAPGFDAWVEAAGPALRTYGVYCALAERHGADWRSWPAGIRRPRADLAHDRDRARFFAWLQWLLDRQLAAAARELPPICDLAIGADPGGADAWIWSDQLLPGFTVGAPPDELNRSGQDWGFPAFNPTALVAGEFEPFRETVRANLRHAAGLRIDHVMGLFRLWLIPAGASPADGAYVTYPSGPMLDILAAESRAAKTLVVGEDLGTVQPEVREELAKRRVLSYRLMLFLDSPPSQYPALSMATVTTHDLPTTAALWSGADDAALEAAGIATSEEASRVMRERLARVAGLEPGLPPPDAVLGAYRALARSPARLRAAPLEDALAVVERNNVPGTTDQWPNWRVPLPGGLEGLRRSPRVAALAAVMAGR